MIFLKNVCKKREDKAGDISTNRGCNSYLDAFSICFVFFYEGNKKIREMFAVIKRPSIDVDNISRFYSFVLGL